MGGWGLGVVGGGRGISLVIGLNREPRHADTHAGGPQVPSRDPPLSYIPRPHISSALQHMRFGVTTAAVVLSLCVAAQVVVWSIVHYTEIRIETLAPTTPSDPLQVIRASMTRRPAGFDQPIPVDSSLLPSVAQEPHAPIDPNQVASAGDLTLRRASAITQSVGVLAALLFGALVFQGVVVAGGSGAPGIEKAVTAGSWSLVIVLLTLPLSTLLPSLPFAGVFVSYDQMVRGSDAYRGAGFGAPGWMGFYGSNLLMPFILIVGVGLVVARFRSGIEAGVIVTNMSQLDEKLEREIRAMNLGQLAQPRALGALQSAIGSAPQAAAAPMGHATAFNEPPARPQRPLAAPTTPDADPDPDLERMAESRRRPF